MVRHDEGALGGAEPRARILVAYGRFRVYSRTEKSDQHTNTLLSTTILQGVYKS